MFSKYRSSSYRHSSSSWRIIFSILITLDNTQYLPQIRVVAPSCWRLSVLKTRYPMGHILKGIYTNIYIIFRVFPVHRRSRHCLSWTSSHTSLKAFNHLETCRKEQNPHMPHETLLVSSRVFFSLAQNLTE